MNENENTEIDKLLIAWEDNFSYCSIWGMMAQSVSYAKLVAIGNPVIPRVLKLLNEGKRWIGYSQLLRVLTNEEPDYKTEKVGGFSAIKVANFAQAWINWANKKGIEIPKD